jgi:hypothetical protein
MHGTDIVFIHIYTTLSLLSLSLLSLSLLSLSLARSLALPLARAHARALALRLILSLSLSVGLCADGCSDLWIALEALCLHPLPPSMLPSIYVGLRLRICFLKVYVCAYAYVRVCVCVCLCLYFTAIAHMFSLVHGACTNTQEAHTHTSRSLF